MCHQGVLGVSHWTDGSMQILVGITIQIKEFQTFPYAPLDEKKQR